MNFNDFAHQASRTFPLDVHPRDNQLLGALGAAGEIGECADLVKKHHYYHQLPNLEKLSEEIGDVLWYLALLADSYGLSLEAIAVSNSAKLRERHPHGFDPSYHQKGNRPHDP